MSVEKMKLIKPYISFDEIKADLEGVFDSGQLTRGQHVAKFLDRLTEYTDARHAFLTTSATTALTVCLKVLGVGPGDKVAVSDFSFPATANVVEDLGATPVFIDVDRATYNMSHADLKGKISNDLKAVIFVDAFGNPSGINEIKLLCEKWELPLIEDAACAIGSAFGGKKVGSIADLTCFSFHPRKLLTTGEGGAILTSNKKYAELLEVKLNHGARGMKNVGLDFIDFGFNYRMSEIQALMGWCQLEKLDDIVRRRDAMAKEYKEGLIPLELFPQLVAEGYYHNVQSVVFTVPAGVDRNALIMHLANENIESTLGTYCLSGTTFYKNKYNDIQPNSHWLESNTITLPCHDDVHVSQVISAIKSF